MNKYIFLFFFLFGCNENNKVPLFPYRVVYSKYIEKTAITDNHWRYVLIGVNEKNIKQVLDSAGFMIREFASDCFFAIADKINNKNKEMSERVEILNCNDSASIHYMIGRIVN